jgi:hypothetical protein
MNCAIINRAAGQQGGVRTFAALVVNVSDARLFSHSLFDSQCLFPESQNFH